MYTRDGADTGGHGGALIVQVLHETKEWPYVRAWYRVGNIPLTALVRGLGDDTFVKTTELCRPLNPRVWWPQSLLTTPRDIKGLLLLLGLTTSGAGSYNQMIHEGFANKRGTEKLRATEQRARDTYMAWLRKQPGQQAADQARPRVQRKPA